MDAAPGALPARVQAAGRLLLPRLPRPVWRPALAAPQPRPAPSRSLPRGLHERHLAQTTGPCTQQATADPKGPTKDHNQGVSPDHNLFKRALPQAANSPPCHSRLVRTPRNAQPQCRYTKVYEHSLGTGLDVSSSTTCITELQTCSPAVVAARLTQQPYVPHVRGVFRSPRTNKTSLTYTASATACCNTTLDVHKRTETRPHHGRARYGSLPRRKAMYGTVHGGTDQSHASPVRPLRHTPSNSDAPCTPVATQQQPTAAGPQGCLRECHLHASAYELHAICL